MLHGTIFLKHTAISLILYGPKVTCEIFRFSERCKTWRLRDSGYKSSAFCAAISLSMLAHIQKTLTHNCARSSANLFWLITPKCTWRDSRIRDLFVQSDLIYKHRIPYVTITARNARGYSSHNLLWLTIQNSTWLFATNLVLDSTRRS